MDLPVDARLHRKWTRREYEAMVEVGILGEKDPVELIEGEILLMSPESDPHSTATALGILALQKAFGRGFHVRACAPIVLGDASMPQPDLVVARGEPRDYASGHPRQPPLVMEVSQTSRTFDLGEKAIVYARRRIKDYWVVDLEREQLVVHRSPSRSRYRTVTVFRRGQSVKPLDARRKIAVADLLP